MVVLPSQGAVDHPVAVCISLAVVPGELEAGRGPQAHPQVLGCIDLCATQGREERSQCQALGTHPIALSWLHGSLGVHMCDVHDVPLTVPLPQGMSLQKGLGDLLSFPAQHRLRDTTYETNVSAGAFTASLSKLLRELVAYNLKKKSVFPLY